LTSAPALDGPDAEEDFDGIDWHEVVDIVCAGAGDTMRAAVVAAEAAGLDAIWVSCGAAEPDDSTLAGRLGLTDPPTVAYLTALTEDITLGSASGAELVTAPRPQPPTSSLNFFGGQLRTWAQKCLDSPYGVLRTTPTEAPTLGLPVGVPGERCDLSAWLAELADADGIEPEDGAVLRSLVFVGPRVAGVIIDDADGARWVKATSGVVLPTGLGSALPTLPKPATELVFHSRMASRFARLELTDPA